MLADPAPAIIEIMDGTALAVTEIATRLSAMFDIEAGVATEDIILARLDELAALGLVTRVPG